MLELLASAILQTQSLAYPLPTKAVVSSGYSESRYHPILHTDLPHRGLDFVADEGTPVTSAIAGTVVLAKEYGGYGNCVIIENKTERTLYGHLSAIEVTKGQTVAKHQRLGRVGSTGYSTGNHLHFEYALKLSNGWTNVDPTNNFNYSGLAVK